ncbi:MAG: polyprenol monophosphomannose synthase [Chloroflexota bacterium]
MPNSTIIIPTYNERENLRPLVTDILSRADAVDVLIVDDDSPDGTGQVADELAAESARVHVLHRAGKLGLGTAYVSGFRWALERGADFVFSMDGDLSHDPQYLPDLWRTLQTHDVAVGSRYLHGISVVNWPLNRILLSYFANFYVRHLTGLRVRDCTSGFVGYRRRVLEAINFESVRAEGYAFLIEMKYRAQRQHFTIGEAPIIFVDRRMGVSKLSQRVMIEAFWLPWRLAVARMLRRDPNA